MKSNRNNKSNATEAEAARRPALDEAARYMENRMRTVHEVRQHLAEKGYEASETEQAVSQLIEYRYLDDSEYARRYFEYARGRHRGHIRSFKELEEKGIDRQIVQFAYEDYCYESGADEYEDALELAHRDVDGSSGNECIDDRMIARMARRLEGRGYPGDVIIRVIAEMRRWKNAERETEER